MGVEPEDGVIMIESLRRGTCVLSSIACLLCFVLLMGTGDAVYFVLMIGLGFIANWVYPRTRNRNQRKK